MTRLLATLFAIAVLVSSGVSAATLDTRARAAIVLDVSTGAVLLEKNADAPLPPASMSKLMTLFMVFDALKEGRLGLTTKFRVSEKAWQMGGSKMFVKAGDSISVEDLLRGVIIQSGNDACVVLAEGLAGSEAEFASRMTRKARDIGLQDSVFVNSTGWPHPDHRMSARDLATLASHIITEFPEYYPYFAETTFTWEDITQENRNPLLALDIGADGLKTGHTEEAGYGLVGSAVRDDRRIVFAIMGLSSVQARAEEAERVVSWAFREFTETTIFQKDKTVTTADVWLGAADTVALVPETDITVIIPYAERSDVNASAIYSGPVEAPISKGQSVGKLVVSIPSIGDQSFPLVAGEDVAPGNFLQRMMASAMLLSQKVIDAARSNAE